MSAAPRRVLAEARTRLGTSPDDAGRAGFAAGAFALAVAVLSGRAVAVVVLEGSVVAVAVAVECNVVAAAVEAGVQPEGRYT